MDKSFQRRYEKSEREGKATLRKSSKFEYYFLILVGFITFVFGFISLAVYLAILYLAPIVSNLTGLTFVDSRYILFVLIMLTTSGFFVSAYPFSKAIGGNSSFHIILAFVSSGVALGVQVFKLAFTGPTWVGIDLLQESGNTVEMMYLTAVYFVYSLVLFVLEFTVLRKELAD
ncbi:MAG TPA: hypothetical protein PKI14_11800 [Fervidobacterium sp.]|nr:hypothetical protein [Fervidobacterium sp.]HPP17945.1 hypothetical protein [Fervidobacterium sp.]HUM43619.1 hypothetical protein [Fervidobacterium sp.]